ncbi:hypothetical protein WA026_006442 [Henosepilachna vigintioctopunctata]|uniref:CD63 antigen n=1 Tax=Henosepilachna vigintioctopunctata TaxID=420089 RepID=A0AAW1TIB9_9CUCU
MIVQFSKWLFYMYQSYYNVDIRVQIMAKDGCCSTNCLKNALNFFNLLFLYIFLLVLIVSMEFMVALLGYIYKENVNDDLRDNLNETMLKNYNLDLEKTQAIDSLQKEFACCGAIRFEDWRYSAWIMSNVTRNLVPDSCCKSISLECGVRDHPSNINYDGCLSKMEDRLKNSLIIIICVGLGVALSQIIGIILAIKLYLNLKEPIDINELRRILHNT